MRKVLTRLAIGAAFAGYAGAVRADMPETCVQNP